MKVGMIQSSYLPWRGYFDLIDDVDLFVVYDDVQYTRKDWRNRNRIKTSNGLVWITVPVTFSRKRPVHILDAPIDYSRPWQRKHVRSISLAYGSAPYYAVYCDELASIINTRYATISALNVALIEWVMTQLNIDVPLRFSSDFSATGDKTDRIIAILRELRATDYLVGPAARAYIKEDTFRGCG